MSIQSQCLSHFPISILISAATGPSHLNQMSSGSRSHDENFMESWIYYKFYNFTVEIFHVLLTHWEKIYLLLLWFINDLLLCTLFSLQNVNVAFSNVFYIILKNWVALIEENILVLLPVEEKTGFVLGSMT